MLRVENLSKSFGALTVVDQVSTVVRGGECLGIMGPNGAGKSTFFDLLTGVTAIGGGEIFLDDQPIHGLPTERRVLLGMSRAFQVPKPFSSLTVGEHLLLAAVAGAGLRDTQARERAEMVLEKTGLASLAGERGANLRLLDRKRLELAKALATGPKVLLLDEISGGLTDHEVHDLIALIRRLKSPGLSILWIEHIAHALKAVSDRILMLHLGRTVIEASPGVVTGDQRVRELYLGTVEHA